MILENALPRPVKDTWQRTGLTGRLGTGLVVIILLTLAWDQMSSAFNTRLPWPMLGLVAAVGWARIGLSIRPMLALLVLGLIIDSVSQAPFGVFPIVFLSTYWLLTMAGSVLGAEVDPVLGSVFPFVGLACGYLLLWISASVIVSAPVDVAPLLMGWVLSSIVYAVFEGVFDLDSLMIASRSS